MDRRDTLLLACSAAESRTILRSIFEDSYNILEANNSSQTMLLLEQNHPCIAAVMLDISLLEKHGHGLQLPCEDNILWQQIPAIVVAEQYSPEMTAIAFQSGATDVIPLQYDPYAMQQRVQNIVELYMHKGNLEDLVQEQAQILRHATDSMVDAILSIIEYRSAESGQHILRIRHFTKILMEEVARNCPQYALTEQAIGLISSASVLHDIGKISIPDSILNKPGKLTAEEMAVMRGHTITGCNILESLRDIGNEDYLRYAYNICRYHHERWDGSGYPEGIAGDKIPICAQVVGLADAYDALTTKRIYKEAFVFETAVNMILRGECGAFSPTLLECFKQVCPRFESLARAYADGLSPKSEHFDTTLPTPNSQSGNNTLEIVQAKYLSLIHHINAFVAEVDLDNNLYHLIYNPYLELTPIHGAISFSEIAAQFEDQIIVPEDRELLARILHQEIPRFLREGLQKQSHQLRLRSPDGGSPTAFEITLLGTGSTGQAHNKFLIILRKAEEHHGNSEDRELRNQLLAEIAQSKNDNKKLLKKIERYEIILKQTENVLFEWDIRFDTISFSDTWEEIFGFKPFTRDVRNGLASGVFFHPDDLPQLRDRLYALESGSSYQMAEVRIAKRNGRYLWCRFRATAIRNPDGSLQKICGIIINIDEEKRTEQALQDRVERDALTKMLNKQASQKRAQEYLDQYAGDAPCALLVIDLDNFKYINDHYGHLFGDTVLRQAAQEIRKMFRVQDIVGRIGGDEFMILMRGVDSRELVEMRCSRLTAVLRNLFAGQEIAGLLSCSIGVALSPEHGTTYVDLFRHADQALYQAKNLGRDRYVFYNNENPVFHSWRNNDTVLSARIDSDEQPGLANNSIIQHIFQKLYKSSDVKSSVAEILAQVGQQMNVSRVYIFENSPDDRFCSNTFEWCNTDVQPQRQHLQNICYETDIPGFRELFDNNGIFYCPDVTALPKDIYDIVAPQNIKSMLMCSVRNNGKFAGYVGFDECSMQRLWTKEQIDVLTHISEMLSIFLLKKRAEERTVQRLQDLTSILDNQNAWIYVIDPDSWELQFLNEKVRRLIPGASEGRTCYQDFWGRNTPCENCPVHSARQKAPASNAFTSAMLGFDLQAEASLIQWNGEDACMITCRRK